MMVCPTVSELRFYGCCHPCFEDFLEGKAIGLKYVKINKDIMQIKRNESLNCKLFSYKLLFSLILDQLH